MRRGKWRQRAEQAILEAQRTYQALTGEIILPSCSDDKKRQFVQLMDEHYPFGRRAQFPYKAWLKERRNAIDWLYQRSKPVAPVEGQGALDL